MQQIINFVLELYKLKTITRKTRVLSNDRYENSAEHSWQIAMFASSLAHYADTPVDVNRVIAMLLVHDIGEIDTGDTIVYQTEGAAERKAADIMAAIIAGDDPRAAKAAVMFVRMMGVVAGNLALTHLPFGGIYLTGGVARHFSPHLVRFGFAQAFRDKGRFAEFMDAFAVWSIEDDYAALQGCAAHLADLIHA